MSAGKLKILCVDDDEDILAIVEMALALVGGHEVIICSRGADAVKAAPGFAPDFILLDFMMPEMDGPATMMAIREIESLREAPIAFMTARVQPHEVEEYLEMGACSVVPKPFDPMTLSEEVNAIFEAYQAKVSAQRAAS